MHCIHSLNDYYVVICVARSFVVVVYHLFWNSTPLRLSFGPMGRFVGRCGTTLAGRNTVGRPGL